MCIAVPSKIVDIHDQTAVLDIDGVRREASLMLVDDVSPGDYVIVHAGFAISKVDEALAEQTLRDMRAMLDIASRDIASRDIASREEDSGDHDTSFRGEPTLNKDFPIPESPVNYP
ncbi:MAG: HypC/HybG/HupF family hydrogenase formation chaperone [Desulfamplus sp.]|nr:HypC/HybG/HupF family hydrogenase formation chaperone [Desulfamplus sp.]